MNSKGAATRDGAPFAGPKRWFRPLTTPSRRQQYFGNRPIFFFLNVIETSFRDFLMRFLGMLSSEKPCKVDKAIHRISIVFERDGERGGVDGGGK